MSRSMPLLRRLVLVAALLAAAAVPAAAPSRAEPGETLPRFASLSSDKVFLRQGPGYAYRILWVYHRKGLPVLITDAFDVWRKLRLPDGAEGWVHVAMLSDRRTVVVTGRGDAPLRADAGPRSRILALAAPGVVAKLDHCEASACEVRIGDNDGYIARVRLWGVSLGKDGS